MAAIDAAVAGGYPAITTNSNGNPERRRVLLNRLGTEAIEEVLDPGEDEVVRRLSGRGGLSRQCRSAVDRWYRYERFTRPYYQVKECWHGSNRYHSGGDVAPYGRHRSTSGAVEHHPYRCTLRRRLNWWKTTRQRLPIPSRIRQPR